MKKISLLTLIESTILSLAKSISYNMNILTKQLK